jgi:monoamine oxidase
VQPAATREQLADLTGVSVLVAGAGLAGLAAARDLARMGAAVTIIDARDRVGGRVHTVRDGFQDSQHAEAGGDMIDDSHQTVRALAGELGLKLTRILRTGFAYVRADEGRRPRIVRRSPGTGWAHLERAIEPLASRYRVAEKRWDSPVTTELARQSVASWLDAIQADADLRNTARGLRGFFLADPEELSLVALVDQFASSDQPAPDKMYRIEGGNDRLASALAEPFGDRLRLKTELVAISHRGGGIRASVRHARQVAQIKADYLVLAMPASLVRRLPISPALPAPQHEAIATLKYGKATKTLVQFSQRFWRAVGRARAFGSPLPFGALWEANEDQRGQPGILAMLAGGAASDATRDAVNRDGIAGLVKWLDWLGAADATVLGWRQFGWDADPWARGGYAYFDPAFNPTLRDWLARPCDPIFFAGEHTSQQWQGYMNGAIESGRRAAAEIAATRRLSAART